MTYLHVVPREHDAGCRRGLDPASQFYGVDRERCERCRNLWARLDEVSEARIADAFTPPDPFSRKV